MSDKAKNKIKKSADYTGNLDVSGTLTASLATSSFTENMSIEILGTKDGAKIYSQSGSSKTHFAVQKNNTVLLEAVFDKSRNENRIRKRRIRPGRHSHVL